MTTVIVLRRRDTKESVFDKMLPVDDNGQLHFSLFYHR